MGLKVSTVSMRFENSNMVCCAHPWILAVHVIRVSPSQNPTVSPYHCGTFCTCCAPICTSRRKLAAMPDRNSTRLGVIVTSKLPPREAFAHQRINPSGKQIEAFHCFELLTVS